MLTLQFCPICEGAGELARAYPCRACRGAGLATCCVCNDHTDVASTDGGDHTVCRACLDVVAWRCSRCGDAEAVTKDDDGVSVAVCKRCGDDVELVVCRECNRALEADEVTEPRCADCERKKDDCPYCFGSGGGDYAGIRCGVCRGTGVLKRKED